MFNPCTAIKTTLFLFASWMSDPGPQYWAPFASKTYPNDDDVIVFMWRICYIKSLQLARMFSTCQLCKRWGHCPCSYLVSKASPNPDLVLQSRQRPRVTCRGSKHFDFLPLTGIIHQKKSSSYIKLRVSSGKRHCCWVFFFFSLLFLAVKEHTSLFLASQL